MASLQHIDEPIIGLFYSGPTGYCDSVSVMKESRFSSYFFVSAEWLTQCCQSGVASLCCNLPFCDGVRIFPRRLWRLLSDWNTISCLLICHLDFGVCPTWIKFVNHKSKQQPVPCSGIFKESVFQVMWYPIKLRQKLIVQWKAVTLLRYTSGK